jgi:tyrosyl-tRNA synthetase
LTPQTLKAALTEGLLELMKPIQAEYQVSQEWQDVTLKAYPPPVKKEKKKKNLGTRFPGAKGGENAEAEVTKRAEDLTIADVQATEANPTA